MIVSIGVDFTRSRALLRVARKLGSQALEAHAPISQVHLWAEEIQHTLRQAYPRLASVVIHTEPPE